MPTISMFYGIIIRMLFMDTQQHHLPHLHIEYQGQQAVVSLPNARKASGFSPRSRARTLKAA